MSTIDDRRQTSAKKATAAEDAKKATAAEDAKKATAAEDAKKATAAEDAKKATAAEDAKKATAAEDAKKAATAEDAKKAAGAPDQVELFTDAKGGLWAGVTTAFCVGIVAVGNLMLLAAALGQQGTGPDLFVSAWWVGGTAIATGLVVGLTRIATRKGVRSAAAKRQNRWGAVRNEISGAALLGLAAGLATALIVAMLFGVAWLSASGRSLAWQPVVGLSLSVVAVAAFGGFFLASRRSRVGFAASFVLTFLVLLSYMLTLDGLAAAADGGSSGSGGDDLTGAAAGIRDLLTDFRGSVALIVGFYFGTDAAVSVVKMFRTNDRHAHDIARLDRDLAVPPPQRSGEG